MLRLAGLAVLVFSYCACADALRNMRVQLRMNFISHGFQCRNGVFTPAESKSLSVCILLGTSTDICHAVNYNVDKHTSEMVSSHATVLDVQADNNYTFTAFDNRHGFQNTGVDTDCITGAARWKQQSKGRFLEFQNVIHSNDSAKESHVCKAIVGDNEIPGVVTVNDKQCKNRTIYSDFYRVLVLDPDSCLTASWVTYMPEGSFIGGHSDQYTPFYTCRAAINSTYYTGYYDPATAMPYVHSGNVNHPNVVDLLAFLPNGPTDAGPAADLPFPCYHVRLASTGYHMVEHWGNNPLPDRAVTSNVNLALGKSSTVYNIMTKFVDASNCFWMVYGSTTGRQIWGYLLLTSLSYEWVSCQASSDVPYNVPVLSYTIGNVHCALLWNNPMIIPLGHTTRRQGRPK